MQMSMIMTPSHDNMQTFYSDRFFTKQQLPLPFRSYVDPALAIHVDVLNMRADRDSKNTTLPRGTHFCLRPCVASLIQPVKKRSILWMVCLTQHKVGGS